MFVLLCVCPAWAFYVCVLNILGINQESGKQQRVLREFREEATNLARDGYDRDAAYALYHACAATRQTLDQAFQKGSAVISLFGVPLSLRVTKAIRLALLISGAAIVGYIAYIFIHAAVLYH